MKIDEKLQKHKWSILVITLVLILLLRLCWVFTIPFDKAPDEIGHFGIMSYIAQYHKLPVAGDPLLVKTAGFYSKYYGPLPSLPFILGAIGIAVGKLIGSSQLYLYARFMSVILGIATVYLSYGIAKLLFKRDYFMQLTVPITVLLIPQSTFIFAYANNDSFVIFAMTLCFYLMAKCAFEQWTNKNAIFLGISVGFVLLSKYNAYIIVPLVGLLFIMSFWKNYKEGMKYLSLSVLSSIFVSGWWFIRNFLIYKGDILGVKTSYLTSGSSYQGMGWSIYKFLGDTPWIRQTFESTWATFDYMSIRLPQWYYNTIKVILLASVVGIIIFLIKTFLLRNNKNDNQGTLINDDPKPFKIMGLIYGLSIILAISLSIWNSYSNDFQPQGKYLFSILIPFVVIFIFGLKSLLISILPKQKYFVICLLIIFFIMMNLYSIFILEKEYIFPIVNETNEIDLINNIEKGEEVEIKNIDHEVYIHTNGADPKLFLEHLNIIAEKKQLIILKFDTDTFVQIFWETNTSPGFRENKSYAMNVKKGKDYIIRIGNFKEWNGTITSIRLDPGIESNKDIVLKKLEIY